MIKQLLPDHSGIKAYGEVWLTRTMDQVAFSVGNLLEDVVLISVILVHILIDTFERYKSYEGSAKASDAADT